MVDFNKTVHESDANGDPVRNLDGSLKLKTTWQKSARDHKGRAFNTLLHGEKPELDDSGNLKMRRRDDARKPMGATNKTETFVSQYRENGYSYRLVNNDPGRVDTFKQNDWEVVMGTDGVAQMDVGQGRQPGTKGILMRKPEEWYEADQIEKDRLLNAKIEEKTKPAEGQYGSVDTKASPLR